MPRPEIYDLEELNTVAEILSITVFQLEDMLHMATAETEFYFSKDASPQQQMRSNFSSSSNDRK